jgi:hypothetical protein
VKTDSFNSGEREIVVLTVSRLPVVSNMKTPAIKTRSPNGYKITFQVLDREEKVWYIIAALIEADKTKDPTKAAAE